MSDHALLKESDRAALVALARAALRHRLLSGPSPRPPESGPLAAPRAAFVMLSARGETRASVGTLEPSQPLGELVAGLAARAATEDPRFAPLRGEDLADLRVRLAVLGPVRRLEQATDLEVGRDGAAVTHGWHRGVLLPSASSGKAWDAPMFLKHACLAAGLPARAHLDQDAVVEVFEAEEFGE
jgi:uncharacterized protein